MERILILLRGLPGSGKSTFAKLLSDYICTADDYFIKDGEYIFDPRKLGAAHKWCKSLCEKYMKEGKYKVVVANTNVKASELKYYYTLANKYNYTVFSIIIENRHGGQSTHGVPEETIQRFENKFDIKLK